MERAAFLLITVPFMGVTLWLTHKGNPAVFGTLFFVEIVVAAAIYLFRFGRLREFSLEAFSAKAKFVNDTAEKVKSDAADIASLKAASEKNAKQIESIHAELAALHRGVADAKISRYGS